MSVREAENPFRGVETGYGRVYVPCTLVSCQSMSYFLLFPVRLGRRQGSLPAVQGAVCTCLSGGYGRHRSTRRHFIATSVRPGQ